MVLHFLLIGIFFGHAENEPDDPANPLYQAAVSEGLKVGGKAVTLPPPALPGSTSPEAEHAALVRIAGSERAVAELTRDSVSAPVVLKTRDEPVGGLGTIRSADLWFVVRAGLDEIDPETIAGGAKEPRTVEAANMRFTAGPLSDETLARLGNKPIAADSPRGWYVRLSARLLDRIHVEATDRVVATRSPGSWLIASRTDPAFDIDKAEPNRWYPVSRKGSKEEIGKAEAYPGGVSYAKVSRLATVPGALLVEMHFAFFEPKAWFDGAPILRSKIGVVAQDRVRGLRRELAKSQKAKAPRTSPGAKGG